MPGQETGGVSNFWYSFDYGLAHFISLDGETDFAYSPEKSFAYDIKGNETLPSESETFATNSGPFGTVTGSYKDNKAYEQYQWLAKDLASIDRKKTPWVFAMSHRPMYSSETASYQKNLRAAFEGLLLEHGVDAYFSGHIHWYERLFPLGVNGTIDKASIKDKDDVARANTSVPSGWSSRMSYSIVITLIVVAVARATSDSWRCMSGGQLSMMRIARECAAIKFVARTAGCGLGPSATSV